MTSCESENFRVKISNAKRTIQVIVQSRSGSKVETKSKVHSEGVDWFNVAIPDSQSIKSQVRKLLTQDVPSLNQPITIDITLETNEGDKMVLESWNLSYSDVKDPLAKVHYVVYTRMGLILKSIFCITRSIPAYKIARRQTFSDYKILSSIYVGDGKGKLSSLGQDFQVMQIGVVPTPRGTLTLSVAYRTNLAMSVQQLSSSAVSPVVVSDNHFSKSPQKHLTPAMMKVPSVAQSESSMIDDSQEMWSSLRSSSPSMANSSSNGRPAVSSRVEGSNKKSKDLQKSSSNPISAVGNDAFVNLSSSPISIRKHLGAFASEPSLPQQLDIDLVPEDTPFESLLQAANKPRQTQQPGPPDEVDQGSSEDQTRGLPGSDSQVSDKSSSSQISDVEDFVMVDLHPAFAKSDSSSDLANFYLTFQSAPELELFKDQPTLGEVLDKHIPEQLKLYEQNVQEFDDLVESLRVDDDGTDSN
ncbi:putative autophagy-related protein 13 isoform X2 [Apostichopus japonicus]|uniref:Autophagy-related protein 13 n=1 Tax=Stichopus japonicus TaxID=307972 RepID=A0A2G8JEN2_STIJA|nr:putative autophagy-related protein 13 isoform X2 [Apostichopus japonicus]